MARKIRINIAITLIAVCAALIVSCDGPDEPTPLPASEVGRTVLVYQVADTNLGTSRYNEMDIEEMRTGADAGAIGNDGRLLVYNAGPYSDPLLLEIRKGGVDTLKVYDTSSLSVSSTRMLEVFDDMKDLAPAREYGLVLWSHGDGWLQTGIEDEYDSSRKRSFGYEGNAKKMNVTTLARVLETQDFSFVYFDCCYMASVEVMYELRHATPKIVASATELHVYGMRYDLNLEPFFATGQADLITAARNTFEYYNSFSGTDRTCTMSVIETSGLDRLAETASAIYARAASSFPANYIPQRFMTTSISSCTYFDFRHYVAGLCIDDEGNPRFDGAEGMLAEFDSALGKCVLYAAATPYLWNTIPLLDHCGLSTYILRTSTSASTKNYDTLGWYADVASSLKFNN